MVTVWRIDMLGALKAHNGELIVSRFRTRRVAALLAYLCFYSDRSHRRAAIGEMLWPEQDPKAILHNLRQALSSLRRQIEPPPLTPGAVLAVTQAELQLLPGAFTSDVAEFESLLAEAAEATEANKRIELLRRAVALYKGDLLPGFDDEWVLRERQRLEDKYVAGLRTLIQLTEQSGDRDDAAHYMRIALTKEPYDESLHIALMRHYLASARPSSAVQQFKDLRRLLSQHLRVEPSDEARQVASQARKVLSSENAREMSSERMPIGEPSGLEAPDLLKRKSRLPAMLTRFVGRADELDLIRESLIDKQARLVTIVGPAGAGKTTLGIEAGRLLAGRHGWQVFFVSLADLDEGMILDGIADAVGVRRSSQSDLIPLLRAALGPSDNLLILDNLEHILEGAIPTVSSLLEELPELAILLTSRHTTKMYGEHEVELRPLPVPAVQPEDRSWEAKADTPERLEQLLQYSGVQLFVNRCQLARPDFQLTRNNANEVAAICARLEGLPLALEIAAGLSNVFTLSQMVGQIEDRLTVLSSRRRDIPARHRSLRAAIEYSVETLPARLQRFFFAISTFRGGFTLEGAADVACRWVRENEAEISPCTPAAMQNDTLEMILGLQERSLVHTVNVSDERSARFHLLESFREYAEARLSQEERTELARLHAHFFLEAGATRIPNSGSVLSGVPPPPDLGNLRAATSYYYNQNDFDRAVNMLYDRCQFMADGAWTYERDMIARLGSMRESIGLTPLAKIKLMFMVGKTCVFASRYEEAYSIYQEALEIAKQIGDDRQIVRLCQALGNCAGYSLGTKEALKWFEQVLTHATSHDLLPEQEAAYLGIGTCQWQLGDMAAAEAAFQRAAIVSPQWRNGETFWLVIYNLARIYQDTGRLNESMVLTGDTMRITKRIGELFGIGLSYFLVSRYHWIKGDLQSALANNYESLQYKRRTAFLYWIANGIALHAVLLSELGESETAVTLFGAVNRHGQLESAYHQEHIEALEGLRNTMPLQTFERLWAHGLAMDIYEAYELAVKYRGIG